MRFILEVKLSFCKTESSFYENFSCTELNLVSLKLHLKLNIQELPTKQTIDNKPIKYSKI